MKHLAAYLLLGLGGNTSPSAADIKSVLGAVGIDADDERLEKLIAELEGKNLSEVSTYFLTRKFLKWCRASVWDGITDINFFFSSS